MPVLAPAFPYHLFLMETNHMKTIEAGGCDARIEEGSVGDESG
ncbi:hypothetical protein C8R21_1394 [Nitrosospira multiformis]|uniref:Uncharacterized protein n=1 Tax=Nitrosospira multiformis TaxID=1231 RepID=A0A2T5I569_9PROT|nr:hypothetical protein C8R21_1394 [Nitrosospira multiformis]